MRPVIVYAVTEIYVLPIAAMFTLDLGGMAIAAVQDEYVPTIGSPNGVANWRRRGLDPHLPYFNSGVLVVDISAWVCNEVQQKAFSYLCEPEHHLEYVDQEALNVALCGNWYQLSAEWNVGRYWYRAERRVGAYARIAEEARILHYTTEY